MLIIHVHKVLVIRAVAARGGCRRLLDSYSVVVTRKVQCTVFRSSLECTKHVLRYLIKRKTSPKVVLSIPYLK